MRAVITAVALLALSGCASLTPETWAETATFQAVNAIDAVQTVAAVANDPGCFHEMDELGINGSHPSGRAIIEYQATRGLLQFGVTELLSMGSPGPVRTWLIRAFEAGSIAEAVQPVVNNIEAAHALIHTGRDCP